MTQNNSSILKNRESNNLSRKLSKYRILLEYIIIWENRESYIELIKNFLDEKIDLKFFRRKFVGLRTKNLNKIRKLSKNIESEGIKVVPELHYTPKSINFILTLDNLYFILDYDNVTREMIKEEIFPVLQKYSKEAIDVEVVLDSTSSMLDKASPKEVEFGSKAIETPIIKQSYLLLTACCFILALSLYYWFV